MDEILTEIKNVNSKMNAVDQLLKKPFKTWSEEEKDEFGNHEFLRKERMYLGKKKTQLLELLILEKRILLQRNQNQGIAMEIDSTLITADNSTVIRTPFKLETIYTNEGVPGVFRTYRKETLAKFND
jgi:hypothetical protein